MSPVVVAHGLWMPGPETALLRRRLDRAGFESHLFRFPTVRAGLDQNAERLAEFAGRITGAELHFVGYSLGGVVTLAMLQMTRSERPGRVVCLGAPLNGSQAAAHLAKSRLGRRIVGQSILDLLAAGGLPPWRGTQQVGSLAGSHSFGFGKIVSRVDGPSDGTVAIAETKLDGISDHRTAVATHTTLLFSRPVANLTIAFLKTGKF